MAGRVQRRASTGQWADGFRRRLGVILAAAGGPAALGEASGIPRRSIVNWARGVSVPGVDDARRLCEAAGYSVGWLICGEPEPVSQPHGAPGFSRPVRRPDRGPWLAAAALLLASLIVAAVALATFPGAAP